MAETFDVDFLSILRADVDRRADPTRTVDADGAGVRRDWVLHLSTLWAVDAEYSAHTHRSVCSGKAAPLTLNNSRQFDCRMYNEKTNRVSTVSGQQEIRSVAFTPHIRYEIGD